VPEDQLGKTLILLGLVLLGLGALLLLLSRFPRLPGDLMIRGEHFTLWIPLGTCLLLSILLSLLLSLWWR